MTTELDIRFST